MENEKKIGISFFLLGVVLSISNLGMLGASIGQSTRATASGIFSLIFFITGIFLMASSKEQSDLEKKVKITYEARNRHKGIKKISKNALKDSMVQREVESLIDQLGSGNKNPGKGSKHLKGRVFYMRSKRARVFYTKTGPTSYDIIGYSEKNEEKQLMGLIKRDYDFLFK